jgi:lysophospholipase L1-like esterase
MSPKRPPLRRFLGRLLLLVVPLLLTFGFGELAMRLAGKPGPGDDGPTPLDSKWLTFDTSDELGWIFPPDTTGTYQSSGRHTPVVTNTWGLRGPEVSTDTLVHRMLMLGDSYAFGWGMEDEEGLARLLEKGLRHEFPESPVEVINGSIPGYSIYQQILMLEYVQKRTEIHAVVATLSLANDLIDEKRIRRFAPDRLEEFSYQWRDPASLTARFIAISRLLTFVDQRTFNLQFSLVNTSDDCRNLGDESLRNLEDACRDAGLPLVWVIVPRAQEIRPGGSWRRALNGATDRLRGHFMRLAAELGVPAVDLKPVLLEVQAREEAYLTGDTHWSEAGHRAVADAVLPHLLEIW